MATTINSAFAAFSKNLNVTDRQSSIVTNCKNNVIGKIGAKLKLHEQRGRVIGSWDRDTLTRYLSEGDVDVMVVLHYGANKEWETPNGTRQVLNTFKSILDESYPATPCRVDQNCVTMRLSEFRLDVVPAFFYDDGSYHIPDTYSQRWIRTNPVRFGNGITSINNNMGGKFVPLIKMIKGWNRNAGSPLRSFHLECMMYEHFRLYNQGYTYNSMLTVFLEALPTYLRNQCFDPIYGEQVDAYLDNGAMPSRRQKLLNKAMRAAVNAQKAYALEARNPLAAMNAWKLLLGEFFPTYG